MSFDEELIMLQGVKVYDMSSKRRITFIARDNPGYVYLSLAQTET